MIQIQKKKVLELKWICTTVKIWAENYSHE